MVIEIESNQGKKLTCKDNVVIISKKGTLFSSSREKTIPINQISGIEIKKPGNLINGFMQIQTSGQNVGTSSYTFTGGAFDAASDENSIMLLNSSQYEYALKIKEHIDKYNSKQEQNIIVDKLSVADEILKLKELLDAGVITIDEFNTAKSKII